MTKQQQHELLQNRFGRVPEHYTIYPLPDDKRGGQEYARIGMTTETGEVLLFEFDFCVHTIPQNVLERLVAHDCNTCTWVFMRNAHAEDGWDRCQNPPQASGNECENWEMSRSAHRFAEAEYYKKLHEKHYGKISVSV